MSFDLDPGAKQRTLLAAERNQLASERTFLSWIRTGIACIGGGFAFERIFAFHTFTHQMIAHFIAGALIVLGAGIFIVSFLEYEKAYRQFRAWSPGFYVAMGWRRIVILVLVLIAILLLYLAYA